MKVTVLSYEFFGIEFLEFFPLILVVAHRLVGISMEEMVSCRCLRSSSILPGSLKSLSLA